MTEQCYRIHTRHATDYANFLRGCLILDGSGKECEAQITGSGLLQQPFIKLELGDLVYADSPDILMLMINE